MPAQLTKCSRQLPAPQRRVSVTQECLSIRRKYWHGTTAWGSCVLTWRRVEGPAHQRLVCHGCDAAFRIPGLHQEVWATDP